MKLLHFPLANRMAQLRGPGGLVSRVQKLVGRSSQIIEEVANGRNTF